MKKEYKQPQITVPVYAEFTNKTGGKMDFPIDKIINCDKNKYELSTAMIKYAAKLNEIPELLLEYTAKEQEKRLNIILNNILDGTVKYKFNTKTKK